MCRRNSNYCNENGTEWPLLSPVTLWGKINRTLKVVINNKRLNKCGLIVRVAEPHGRLKFLPRSGTCLEKNGVQNMDGDKLADATKNVETPDSSE